MNFRFLLVRVAVVSLGFSAAATQAHHSFAMFDNTKEIEISGTVKEFQFTNPHSWLIVTVLKNGGVAEDWPLEMASVGVLYKLGVRRDTVQAGQKIVVKLQPLKSGEPGGHAVEIVSLDGAPPPDGVRRVP